MNKKLLESLGLDEKAAKIYLAGLALGTTSVQELARKSGLKRPTVYLHLDELLKKGLFELVPAGKKQYYSAIDPSEIEKRLAMNLEHLRAELPKLSAMRANTMGKPQVRVFEGEEGVRQVYSEMKKANSWRVWSNIGDAYGVFFETYMELCEAIRENGIGVHEIIADVKTAKHQSRHVAKLAGPTYSARTATVEGLENDTIIYGNTVAMFRLSGLNIFVVRIEDKTIADSMRTLFEMAWKTARPFR